MRDYRIYLVLLISVTVSNVLSQTKELSSAAAYQEYIAISDTMGRAFPENEIETFKRTSFDETQLQNYLTMHFKRMDLLSKIKGHHIFVLNSYLHSGNWFKAIGFPKESIKSYKHFFRHYKLHEKELSTVDRKGYNVMRFIAHGILAENYANLGIMDSAAAQHQMNMAFTKRHNNIYYPSAINNYGLFLYWHKKDLDSALHYFTRAHELTQAKFPNHTLIGSIRDNIADVYVDQQLYQKAKLLYDINFDFYKDVINEEIGTIDVTRLISAGSQLVTTNIILNRMEDAQKSFDELEKVLSLQDKKKMISSESRLEYLRAKERLLEKQNKIDAAYTTSKRIRQYADSLQKVSSNVDKKWQEEFNDITVDRVALNFKIDQLQKEDRIKTQRAQLRIIALVSSAFIILLMFLFFGRRQHLINAKNKQLLAEQHLENAALKVEQLNSSIKSKERDLSDFAINLTQNQDWAKHLAYQLEAIKLAKPQEQVALMDALDKAIANKVSFDSDTCEFFEYLDKLSDAFYSKLKGTYPNLSKNEIRLCSLIRLKIESRSIATLQNITMASLNTSRYRLRKKLNLSEDVDLDLFIQSI